MAPKRQRAPEWDGRGSGTVGGGVGDAALRALLEGEAQQTVTRRRRHSEAAAEQRGAHLLRRALAVAQKAAQAARTQEHGCSGILEAHHMIDDDTTVARIQQIAEL